MTVNTSGLAIGNDAAINAFDVETHMAFGDGITAFSIDQTALINELLRVAIDSSIKDLGNGAYIWTARIPLGELNSVTISELGLFDAATSGNMSIRELFQSGFTKTDDDEINITLELTGITINKI